MKSDDVKIVSLAIFDVPKGKSDISIEKEAKLFRYNCSLTYEEICHPKLIDFKIISDSPV